MRDAFELVHGCLPPNYSHQVSNKTLFVLDTLIRFTCGLLMLTKDSTKETVLATRLTAEIRGLAQEIAQIKGLKPSEYLRNLVLEDLERRSLISAKVENLKETLKNEQ